MFDPSKPFSLVDEEDEKQPPAFDPSKPFEIVNTDTVTERDDVPEIDGDPGLGTRLVDGPRAMSGGAWQSLGRGVQGLAELNNAAGSAIARLFPDKVEQFLRDPDNLPDILDVQGSVHAVGREVEKAGKKLSPPTERENLYTDVMSGVGQVGGQVALGAVNPALPVAVMAGEGAEQQSRRVDAAGEQGTAAADTAVLAGALVTGLTEKIQLGRLMKASPYLGKLADKIPDSIKSKWFGKILDPAAAGAGEAAQEVVEGMLHDAIEYAAYNDDVEFLQGWEREAAAGGGTGAVFRVLVNAVAGKKARARQYPQAAEFEAARDQEATELFGEASPRMKDPVAPVGEVNSEPTAEPGRPSGEVPVAQPEPEVKQEPAKPKEPAIGDLEAVRRQQRQQLKAEEKAAKLEGDHEVKAPGKRVGVGYRIDGEPDILNFIEDEGGILTPNEMTRRGREMGGEYDGFADFFNSGPQANLRSRSGQSMGDMLAAVEQSFDPNITDEATLKAAITKALQDRQFLVEHQQREESQAEWEAYAYTGERKRGTKKPDEQPISIDTLGVGDSFTIAGQRVTIEDINPDDYSVKLNAGNRYGYQQVQPGSLIHMDRGSLQRVERAKAEGDDPFRQASDRFALQTKEQRQSRRQWLDQATQKWTAHAEQLAPGLMKQYQIKVGSVLDLGREVHIGRERNPANIEAAHIASQKMIYLVDTMVRRPTDNLTMLTLQHEMAHAHWDTLSQDRKAKLEQQWQKEMESHSGPLFRKDGTIKRGVANGVESDIREWYAERIAWNNHQWGKTRTGIGAKPVTEGMIGQAAQNLRVWLKKALEFIKSKFGGIEDIDTAYRQFLDTGPKVVDESAPVAFMTAWHGSPHRFDKFTTEKMGTGEGAQAYGWGMYFAGNKEVAQHYKQRLTEGRGLAARDTASRIYEIMPADMTEEAKLQGVIDELAARRDRSSNPEFIDRMNAAIEITKSTGLTGALYQVDLKPAEDEYLLWDRSFTEQSEKIKSAVMKLDPFNRIPANKIERFERLGKQLHDAETRPLRWTGETIYNHLAQIGQKEASKYLNQLGVRGIKYLDGASRNDGEGSYNYVIFDDADVAIEEVSFAERELATAEQGRTDLEKATRFQSIRNRLKQSPVGKLGKEWLTSAGNMPKAAFLALRSRNSRLNAAIKVVEHTLEDFHTVVRDDLGGWKSLTRAEEQAINDHLAGRQEWEDAPPRLKAVLQKMRSHIDGLSQRLIDEGVIDGSLRGVVEGNVGFYLNRSYRKYDDKKWGQKVMTAKPGTELAKIRTQAARLIHSELRTDLIKELADAEWWQTHPNNKRISRRGKEYKQIHARLEENQDIQPNPKHVENKLEVLLRSDVTPDVFMGGHNPNKKQLGVFKKRKSIPPEIRKLWGEHTDARINYARSVTKTMQILETQRALREIAEAGRGTFLWDKDYEVPGGGVAIAADGNEAMAPLDGLYTTPEIKEALTQSLTPADPGAFLGMWYRVNGLVKMSKTVFSPVTQLRNHVANYAFLFMNGHFNAGKFGKSFGVFTRELMAPELDAAGNLPVVGSVARGLKRRVDTNKVRQYITRMTRLGVIGESVHANEIQEALRDAMKQSQGEMSLAKFSEHVALKAVKYPGRKAIQLYQLNDDIFKVYAFENERSKLAWAKPELSAEQLDSEAAARVRDTLPTYSMIPKAFQKIRRGGMTGTFLSFSVESMRTMYKSIQMGVSDIRSPNPRMRTLGALRLGSMAAGLAMPAIIQGISMALSGVDEEEDRKSRNFGADWSRNSNFIYLGKDGEGEYRRIDLSYLDVFNWQKRILNSTLYGEDLSQISLEMLRETYSPIFGEGLVTKAVLDVARNTKDSGAPVWEPAADWPDRWAAAAGHIWKTAEPGLVTTARRIIRGYEGYVSPTTGKVYKLEDELLALGTGARMESLSVPQSLEFKAGKYMSLTRSAARLYNRVANTKANPDMEEINKARIEANEARFRVWQEMRARVFDAYSMGVLPIVIEKSLRDGGLGEEETENLMQGRYKPYQPTKLRNIKFR